MLVERGRIRDVYWSISRNVRNAKICSSNYAPLLKSMSPGLSPAAGGVGDIPCPVPSVDGPAMSRNGAELLGATVGGQMLNN